MRPGVVGRDEAAGHLAGQQPRAADVGVEHRVDQLERHLVGPGRVGDAGVVDEDRHQAEGGLGRVDRGDDLRGIGDVERNADARRRRSRRSPPPPRRAGPADGRRPRPTRRPRPSVTANRRPRPEVAPVTRATWPVRSTGSFMRAPRGWAGSRERRLGGPRDRRGARWGDRGAASTPRSACSALDRARRRRSTTGDRRASPRRAARPRVRPRTGRTSLRAEARGGRRAPTRCPSQRSWPLEHGERVRAQVAVTAHDHAAGPTGRTGRGRAARSTRRPTSPTRGPRCRRRCVAPSRRSTAPRRRARATVARIGCYRSSPHRASLASVAGGNRQHQAMRPSPSAGTRTGVPSGMALVETAGGHEDVRRPARPPRRRPHDRRGRGRRGDRAVRFGQVHAVPHDQPPRADRQRHHHLRRPPAAGGGQGAGPLRADIGMVFQSFNLFAHRTHPRQRHARADQGPQARQGRRPGVPRGRCSSGLASPTRPTATRPSSPAGSSSGPPSPAPWPWNRSSCCSTSRPRPSIPR